MHCYFLLNIKYGASQLYLWAQIQLWGPGEDPMWGRAGRGPLWGPGEGPLRGPRGASNSLAPALPHAHRSVARSIVFSSVCLRLCLFVRRSVCQHDNSWTVRDIITKCSGHHPRVKREAKFKNGYCGVREWWFIASDVLFCNVGAAWRMTLKELTHTITERSADGAKTLWRTLNCVLKHPLTFSFVSQWKMFRFTQKFSGYVLRGIKYSTA